MSRVAPLVAALLMAATPLAAQDIVVSSKIDTEGGLLGNMILLALQDAGLPVQDRLQLGGTPIMRDAIVAGQIDIYPEYTANGAFFFNEADSDVWKDAAQGYARVAELDREQNDIVWLTPSPANNTWAIALRQDVAEENGLTTMTQMGEWIAGGGQAQQTSGVNAAMVYGTDGAIAEAGLLVMEDDKAVQPVYQPAPIVRSEVLEAHPRISEVLEPIFASLTLQTLQTLNGRIQVGGEPAAAVAQDYLTQAGFLD